MPEVKASSGMMYSCPWMLKSGSGACALQEHFATVIHIITPLLRTHNATLRLEFCKTSLGLFLSLASAEHRKGQILNWLPSAGLQGTLGNPKDNVQ